MLSVLEPKDKILTVNNCVFGKWLGVIARRLGFKVVEVEVDWRRSIDVEIIKERLEREGDVKVVAVVHNETSTGVKNSIEEIGRVVKEHSALFLADTVSSTGGDTVKTDEWRIDLNCTCSYKCFGAPSGLSIVAVSDEAWETMARRRKEAGSFAFDLYRWLQMWIPPERGGKLVYGYRRHPIEPSPHMTYALNEALKVIHEEGLEKRINQGAKALVGNRGYRRYLITEKDAVRIDYAKVQEEARYDGKWVLRTNTDLPGGEVALQYKRLLMVERFFRAAKSLLETRPIFHRTDLAITGHLFTSFLALLLMHELTRRLHKRGWKLEWADILRDLLALEEVEVRNRGKRYLLRTPLKGVCGKVLQGAGVAIPPSVREVKEGCGAKTSSQAL